MPSSEEREVEIRAIQSLNGACGTRELDYLALNPSELCGLIPGFKPLKELISLGDREQRLGA